MFIFTKENRNIIMWLLEETFNGRNLTEIINNDHQNPKYLPGIVLPSSIRASNE
jgi:glycerol-3-phosphate dehydrogenase (NAD+)